MVVGPPEFRLGDLQIVDVRQQHAPPNDVAVRIANRKTAIREPVIDAIRPPKTLHDFVWTAGRDRACEDLDDVRQILRMNCVVRPPLPELLERLAEVLEHLAVDDFDVTGCAQECDQPRDAVDDQTRFALAFAQGLLGALALVDVDEQVVPADDVAVRIPERKSARLKPAVDAIETSSTYFELEGFT